MGWKITGSIPPEVNKCILIVAPHTSSTDFAIGRLACWYMKIDASFLIKKESFKGLFGLFLKALGGVPVDRDKGSSIVHQVVKLINNSKKICIIITPEGTRKLVKNWKKGYYFIATEAKIPIVFGFVDYAKKSGGVGPTFYPSGDYEKDFEVIANFYRGMKGKHPENFNL